MALTLEERIEKQLDRLDNSQLTEREIEKIERKIAYLRTLQDE